MPTVFPSHMYVLAPDHLWYLSLQPRGIGQVAIRYGVAFAPEKLAAANDRDALVEQAAASCGRSTWRTAAWSRACTRAPPRRWPSPGPLSWLERENHEFAGYIARRLTA